MLRIAMKFRRLDALGGDKFNKKVWSSGEKAVATMAKASKARHPDRVGTGAGPYEECARHLFRCLRNLYA